MFCVILAGCARIADPRPPERRVVEAVEDARDLETIRIEPEGFVDTVTEAVRNISPPVPPANFTAVAENDRITLFWTPSPSADVAGYRIFRKNRTDDLAESRRPLHGELITGISYRDESVKPGVDYIYEIQAVDRHGCASEIVAHDIRN